MSYDIGPRIGIEGEANFKQAISQINTNLKTLASEMNLVSSSYDKNDKSMEGITAKNAVLAKQMDAQKDKVAELAKALQASKDKYGDNDKATQSWQQQLNKANADLNNMERELKEGTAALDNFGKETDDASEKTGKFSGALGKIGSGLKNVGGAVGKAAVVGIAAVGTAAAGAALGAFKLAKDAGKAADDLITLSNQTGISTERLQEMQYASRFLDVDLEKMTGSQAKLTKSMDAARNGTKLSEEAFKKLGIEIQNQDGSLRDSKTVWAETIDALGNVANETDRDALSLQLFGKSAMELNPLIKAGSEELNRLGQEAHDVGAVLGDDAVNQAGKFDDMMQVMDASLKGLATTAGVAVMPMITDVVKSVSGMVPAITNAIKTGNFDEAGKAISDGLSGLLNKVTGALPGLATMASNIIGGLVGTLVTAIPQVLPPLIGATVQLLSTLVQVLTDNGPMLITAGINALMMLIDGIVDTLPNLIDAAVQIVLTLVDALLDKLPELITAAIKIIVALAQGLIKALPKLIEKVPEIIDAIVKAVIGNLPALIVAAIQIIGALVIGILQSIPKLIAVVPQLFKSLGEAFKNIKWGELGGNIIKGIIDGVKNAATNLANSVVNAAKGALKGVKDFLGIESPSTVMRDQVGKMMGAGMAEGITASAKQVNAAMNGINKELTTSLNVSGSVGATGSGSGMTVINVPVSLDGQIITKSTGRIQSSGNKTRSRALGVPIWVG